MQNNLIQFISTYRGQTSYRVLAGPLKGERVTVRPLSKSWYEQDFKDNAGRAWRDDPDDYNMNVLSSVGLVCCPGFHVPADIVAAVNAMEKPTRDMAPEKYCGDLKSGVWVDLHGWQPAGNFVLKYGDTLYNYSSLLEAEFAVAKHPDIIPDEAWEEDDDCETIRELHLTNINGYWKLQPAELVPVLVEPDPEQQEAAPAM